jgi:hypothetical protein
MDQVRRKTVSGCNRSRFRYGVWLIAVCMLILNACASALTTVAPHLPGQYEKLGTASGSACGSLMISGAYNFIPVGLNSRVERAYRNAVESVPGATALAGVTMQEQWYWWVLGSTRCVTITGEAIR